MVPYEIEALPAFGGRPADHVDLGPVMPVEVHVDRRDVLQSIAQIPDQGHGLQKDLRDDHGRSKIDEGPAFQPGYGRTEGLEIVQAGLSQSGAADARWI